jgi:FMN phosphatase YigB (HAD superfamily)
LQHLNCVILSCEVRLIKPDYAIYKRCLEGIELLPFEACFIDDRDANVRAARDAGLTALRFQTVESLRNDLMGIGIPVLPRARSNRHTSAEPE